MSNSNFLRIETPRKGIRRIVMNEPERRHVLTRARRAEILQAITEAETDPSIGAIILTGSGGHFSGGGDISGFGSFTMTDLPGHMDALERVVTTIVHCAKPVIAAIEGVAAGGGVGIALAMDMIVAGRNASFVFPFFKIGLVPEAGILYHLPRRVGPGVARRILLNAQTVRGDEAERTGLADVVVDDDKVQDEALKLAERLAAQPVHAFRFAKRILAGGQHSLSDVMREEAVVQMICMQTAEFKTGIEAFLGGRGKTDGSPPKQRS